MENYYEILKIRNDASTDQIKRAYLSLITKFHPDIYKGDKSIAEEVSSSLTEAYCTLKDEEKRKEYDISRQVNSTNTIYQDYSVQDSSENEKNYYGRNYDQKVSRKYFKNTKRRSFISNIFKRLFTSKLFYCLLFVFAVEALIIYFVYVKTL
ncbi:MAG: hypothetical protein EOM55_03615 [Clostridia bacterium]|nr:hypothetical protein [Clostridia bacterium]